MPTLSRRPKPDRRRALELLVSSRDGCTEALLIHAHGFTIELLVEIIRAGLATASTERVIAGRQQLEVACVRLTEAGRPGVACGISRAAEQSSNNSICRRDVAARQSRCKTWIC